MRDVFYHLLSLARKADLTHPYVADPPFPWALHKLQALVFFLAAPNAKLKFCKFRVPGKTVGAAWPLRFLPSFCLCFGFGLGTAIEECMMDKRIHLKEPSKFGGVSGGRAKGDAKRSLNHPLSILPIKSNA